MIQQNTSWQPVSHWYNKQVGASGHEYHQSVIFPRLLEILKIKKGDAVLDLGCGQGAFARVIPSDVYYQGLDAASDLITAAKGYSHNELQHFTLADVTRVEIPITKKDFTHGVMILAAQNMAHPEKAFAHFAERLQTGGVCAIVLNHPCFRIPRQSSWQIDEVKKTQYRRIDRYLSPLEVPIVAHPGKQRSATTWSFHQPLSFYINALAQQGLLVQQCEEWSSKKTSVGKAAKMENRSRDEFPLFLTLVAKKV